MTADKKKTNNIGEDDLVGEIFGEDLLTSDLEDEETEVLPDSDLISEVENDEEDDSQTISGVKKSLDNLKKRTSSPGDIVDGDIDADWEAAETVGEESVLGDNPTPDQDQVEGIGSPWGIKYDSSEELNVKKKIRQREDERIEDEDEISHRSSE